MTARKPVPAPPPTLGLPEAARLLGYSKNVGYELANRGEFPGAFRLPRTRKWRVSRQALEAFLANPTAEQAASTVRRIA